jgi:hypothetical protein
MYAGKATEGIPMTACGAARAGVCRIANADSDMTATMT